MSEMRPPVTMLAPTSPFEEEGNPTEERFVGQPTVYELFYVGSPVMALLEGDPVPVGPYATIHQTEDGVVMKHTDVLTLPTQAPVLREVRHLLRSRPGIVVTVVRVEFVTPEFDWQREVRTARRHAEQALATLVLLLDERVAYRRLGELITMTDVNGAQSLGDITRGIRPYDSDIERRVSPKPILTPAAQLDLENDGPVGAALTCYLAGVEQVKTPVGYILLCSALDALCPGKKNSFNKKDLMTELAGLGIEPDEQEITEIVRARVTVHKGFIDDQFLYSSWASLETYVRRVLRQRLGIRYGWPMKVPTTVAPITATHTLWDNDTDVSDTGPPALGIREEVETANSDLKAALSSIAQRGT